MTGEDRDFRNCGWAGHSKSISGMYECRRKKLKLLPADLGTGICPCRDWIHMSLKEKTHGQAGEKGRETPPTLIGEPEEKA
jgi:hypothetical protein